MRSNALPWADHPIGSNRHLIGIEAQYGEDVEPFRFRVKKKNALQGEQSLQREFNSKGMMLPLVSAATPP